MFRAEGLFGYFIHKNQYLPLYGRVTANSSRSHLPFLPLPPVPCALIFLILMFHVKYLQIIPYIRSLLLDKRKVWQIFLLTGFIFERRENITEVEELCTHCLEPTHRWMKVTLPICSYFTCKYVWESTFLFKTLSAFTRRCLRLK